MGQVIRKSMDETWHGVVIGKDGEVLDVEIDSKEDRIRVGERWKDYGDIMEVIEWIKEV